MKICTKCKLEKPLSSFGKLKKTKDGLNTNCKDCKQTYFKEHYKNNEARRIALKQTAIKNKERLQKYRLQYYHTHPCSDCGNTDYRVLDFDHLKDKEFNISDGIKWGYSLERIKAEIAKCEVVCSNCHRIRTWERLNSNPFWPA